MNNLNADQNSKTISNAINELDVYGYTKIDGFLTCEEVDYLLNSVNENYERINSESKIRYEGVPNRDFYDKILYNIHNLDKKFIEILSRPVVEAIAKNYLNDPYYRFIPEDEPNYILNYYNARSSGGALDLHIDSHMPFPGDKTFMMQFVFLLEESTKDNGCTVVVPGSHKSGKYSNRAIKNALPIQGMPGDLIIWDSRLWHGTLKNASGRSRWALVATLSAWWIKQTMNIAETVSGNILEVCSLKEMQLLGMCSVPSRDPFARVNVKCGYEYLLESRG